MREFAEQLWQGKGVSIEEVTDAVYKLTQEIQQHTDQMRENGIEFPFEYVKSAMTNLSEAIRARDDYMLADNLFYEWNEIAIVYKEIIEQLGD